MRIQYFISAERASLSPSVNEARTKALQASIKALGLTSRPSIGRYQGIDEASFVVECLESEDTTVRTALLRLAASYDQECIMRVKLNQGILIGPSGQLMGRLTMVQDTTGIERPEGDHTAIILGPGRYRCLILQ